MDWTWMIWALNVEMWRAVAEIPLAICDCTHRLIFKPDCQRLPWTGRSNEIGDWCIGAGYAQVIHDKIAIRAARGGGEHDRIDLQVVEIDKGGSTRIQDVGLIVNRAITHKALDADLQSVGGCR